jgi:Zn-dependent protease
VHVILLWKGVIANDGDVSHILAIVVGTNYILLFFNLLPFPPLDGGHVAQHLMPYRYRAQYDQFAKYAPFALLAVIAIPQVGEVFGVPAEWLAHGVYKLFGLAFGA